jgi:RNA polymerase sigma-70 factor, ECF subfamily
MNTSERRGPASDDLRLHLTVLRCQSGDERAFAQLMEQFGAKTLAYLSGLLGDDAEDTQQEVWLSVYRRIRELGNPGAFRTWLFRVTRHRAIDSLRKRKRERELLVDTGEDVVAAVEAEDATNPGFEAAAFEAAIAGLPPPQREVLLLRYRDDLSYEEIAVVVGVPTGTIRTRLHHAKRKLNEQLARGQS